MPEDPLHDTERLTALNETSLVDAPSTASLDRYVRIAQGALAAPVVLVSLVDDHRQFFANASGLPQPWATCRQTPLSHSFCQHVVRGARGLVIEDAREHPLLRDNLAIRDLNVIAYLGMPIRSSEGHVLGSFCAIDSQPRKWTEVEAAVLTDLAGAVSDEIETLRRARRAEQSEQRLRELSHRLQEDRAADSERSRSAVHDLRTPLNVIALGLESIFTHEAITGYPELARWLMIVRRNVQHSAALLSSIKSGPETDRSTVDIAELTRETCADLGSGKSAPRVEYGTVTPEPVTIHGDATSVRRCVENLVSNALRFAQTRVVVALSRTRDEAILVVEDDGDGLPSAAAYRTAWEPNTRFHLEEGKSGSGLGLSIVRQIVEHRGGRVSAAPSAMGGARFMLHFPLGG